MQNQTRIEEQTDDDGRTQDLCQPEVHVRSLNPCVDCNCGEGVGTCSNPNCTCNPCNCDPCMCGQTTSTA